MLPHKLLTVFVTAAVASAGYALSANPEVHSMIQQGAAPNDKPWFCHKIDCPLFTVLNKTDDYELRQYVETKWVATNIANIDLDVATYQLFMRLFNYIQGANEDHEKIDMTCPVLTKIIPGQGPACENNFTMSFFISPEVSNPPKPNNTAVYLTQKPALKAYVRSFGGFASKSKWISEARKLAESLPSGAKYVTDYYYTAGYDAPFTLFNRHNEIWFIATD